MPKYLVYKRFHILYFCQRYLVINILSKCLCYADFVAHLMIYLPKYRGNSVQKQNRICMAAISST